MQQEITRVALDAMGGDNAPGELVKGAVDAVNGRYCFASHTVRATSTSNSFFFKE